MPFKSGLIITASLFFIVALSYWCFADSNFDAFSEEVAQIKSLMEKSKNPDITLTIHDDKWFEMVDAWDVWLRFSNIHLLRPLTTLSTNTHSFNPLARWRILVRGIEQYVDCWYIPTSELRQVLYENNVPEFTVEMLISELRHANYTQDPSETFFVMSYTPYIPALQRLLRFDYIAACPFRRMFRYHLRPLGFFLGMQNIQLITNSPGQVQPSDSNAKTPHSDR